jgi:hypothetical protein
MHTVPTEKLNQKLAIKYRENILREGRIPEFRKICSLMDFYKTLTEVNMKNSIDLNLS